MKFTMQLQLLKIRVSILLLNSNTITKDNNMIISCSKTWERALAQLPLCEHVRKMSRIWGVRTKQSVFQGFVSFWHF